jgi:hypothetical protein
LTLALIYQLAGSEKLRWIAIVLSHDGSPLPEASRRQLPGSPT